MPFLILIIFIAVPIAEIAVFIQVGGAIGLFPTIALVIATAVIGVWLLKRQGVAVLSDAKQTIESGGLPVQAVIDGVCLIVAGAFLLTPGLITDAAGFLLLVPGFRRSLARWIVAKLEKGGHIDVSMTRTSHGGPKDTNHRGPGRGPTVIDGEYERVDTDEESDGPDKKGKPDPNSPWRRS